MEKSSFVMYTRYITQIKLLSLEQRGDLLTAIMQYAVGGELPEMDDMTYMVFSVISDQMDIDNDKYQKMVESRRESGRLGGLAKQANATLAKQTVANGSNAKQNVANLADNDNVNVNDNVLLKKECVEKKRFAPPTRQNVADYVAEKGYGNVDIDRFMDYYTSNGWMVGKNKMKDWRAAVRNWNRGSQRQELTANGKRQELTAKTTNRFSNFHQREYDYDEYERMLLGMESEETQNAK